MEEYGEHTGVYLAEVVWWAVRPAWHLLFGGAFERFPDLKFVVTEAAAYWAPDMMWKWDQYMGGGHTTKKLAAMLKGKISKLPSDYFGTNIFIGASTMSHEEIRRRYVIGTDVVMWGTDYPHPEGTWPHTPAKLQADFAQVPVDDTADLLGLTAARVYGFDLDELRPIARASARTPTCSARTPPCAATRRRGPRPGGGRRSTGCSLRSDRTEARRSPGAQHLVAVEGVAGRVGRVVLDGQRRGHLGHRRADPVADRPQGLEVEAVDAGHVVLEHLARLGRVARPEGGPQGDEAVGIGALGVRVVRSPHDPLDPDLVADGRLAGPQEAGSDREVPGEVLATASSTSPGPRRRRTRPRPPRPWSSGRRTSRASRGPGAASPGPAR